MLLPGLTGVLSGPRSFLGFLAAVAACFTVLVTLASPALAASTLPPRVAAGPPIPLPVVRFTDGFATLKSELGDVMGTPLTPARRTAAGDIEQITTTGLAYWRPADNVPVFFDGATRYGLTSLGVVAWTDQALAPPVELTMPPRDYLYATYSDLAPRLDCVFQAESGWQPAATNPLSGAAGLAQFLGSTWYGVVPDGVRQGRDPYDPYAAIDGAAWLAQNRGFTQWVAVQRGLC